MLEHQVRFFRSWVRTELQAGPLYEHEFIEKATGQHFVWPDSTVDVTPKAREALRRVFGTDIFTEKH